MKNKTQKFSKGQFLLRQNENSRHMFVINSGTVRVIREEGKIVTYQNDVTIGGTVGEVALIDPGPRSASAVALGEVETTIIYPEDVEEANKKCPPWFQALARTLAVRTRAVLASIERNQDKYVESSLISLLIYSCAVSSKTSPLKKPDFIIECSEMLRVDPLEVETILDQLDLQNFIFIDNNDITLPNVKSLDEYASQIVQSLEKGQLDASTP